MSYTPSPLKDATHLSPAEARAVFRRKKYIGLTSGFCPGYEQANVAVVPEDMAADFEEYCRLNEAPLPLLFRSQPGELGAPPLATDSDIRTDLPLYDVFSNGRLVDTVQDLSEFLWERYVAFYFGCSWSFETDLADIGVPSSQLGDNYAMFHSNIKCAAVGRWASCPMIVTMKRIPRHLLGEVTAVTARYPLLHGAPVHIGSPSLIGIADVRKPDFGNAMEENEDDIPVFWGCGATVLSAIEVAKTPLAFTHHPGCMFITDKLKSPLKLLPMQTPEVVIISPERAPLYASILSSTVYQLIAKAETIITTKISEECQTSKLGEGSQFVKAVLTLSRAHSVAVIVAGCGEKSDVASRLSGVLALVQALFTLGKKVALISDACNKQLFENCVTHTMASDSMHVEVNSCHELLQQKRGKEFNCFVLVDSTNESPLATECEDHHVKELFQKAHSDTAITTIRVIVHGVPEVAEKAKQHSESDCTVMSRQCNLGAFGLTAGLQLASSCSVHCRYKQQGVDVDKPLKLLKNTQFLPTTEQLKSLLQYLKNQMAGSSLDCQWLSASLEQSLQELGALVSELQL